MFKPHYGSCSQCEKDDQLIVVKAGLCQKCNWENKQAKKKAAGKKSGAYKYVREATGEAEMFREIALNTIGDEATRCWVCGTPIAVVTHNNMAHILAKGKYPNFRLKPENVKILCFNIQGTGCHNRLDHAPLSTLTEHGWKKLFELREKLKQEYGQTSID